MRKRSKLCLAACLAAVMISGFAGCAVPYEERAAEYTVIDPSKHDSGAVERAVREENGAEEEIYEYEEEVYDDENDEGAEIRAEDGETGREDVIKKSEDLFVSEEEGEAASEAGPSDEEASAPSDTEGDQEDSSGRNTGEEMTRINTESIIYSRTADVSRQVRELADSMTKEEKAAELILARCPQAGAADLMGKYGFGGYTLYAVDFRDRSFSEAKEFIAEIKASSRITPFIAVDEEGGDVVRVSKFPAYRETPFRSLREIYRDGGIDGIISDSREKAELLTSLGINMNLAPVCDIAENGDYIYDRTVGASAEETGAAVREIVGVSGEYGLMSCLKHFPGYGSNVDTHTGIARDTRSKDSFKSTDFIPFKAGLSGRYTPAVLVNHNIVECMDKEYPASLSREVHRVLREEIGFDGVIITDDLGMDGISAYTGSITPYVMGILSGNDLLCVSEPERAYNDLISAINDGTLPMEAVNEHVRRVLQMKRDYGLI